MRVAVDPVGGDVATCDRARAQGGGGGEVNVLDVGSAHVGVVAVELDYHAVDALGAAGVGVAGVASAIDDIRVADVQNPDTRRGSGCHRLHALQVALDEPGNGEAGAGVGNREVVVDGVGVRAVGDAAGDGPGFDAGRVPVREVPVGQDVSPVGVVGAAGHADDVPGVVPRV